MLLLVFRAGGREVVQLANSRASIALGAHTYAGLDYSGTLYVADRCQVVGASPGVS